MEWLMIKKGVHVNEEGAPLCLYSVGLFSGQQLTALHLSSYAKNKFERKRKINE